MFKFISDDVSLTDGSLNVVIHPPLPSLSPVPPSKVDNSNQLTQATEIAD